VNKFPAHSAARAPLSASGRFDTRDARAFRLETLAEQGSQRERIARMTFHALNL
jgi:hypothetical protein